MPTDTAAIPSRMPLAFFVDCRQSRSGMMRDFTSITRSRTRRRMNGNVSEWLGAVEGLADVHARLRRVLVENVDGIELNRAGGHAGHALLRRLAICPRHASDLRRLPVRDDGRPARPAGPDAGPHRGQGHRQHVSTPHLRRAPRAARMAQDRHRDRQPRRGRRHQEEDDRCSWTTYDPSSAAG